MIHKVIGIGLGIFFFLVFTGNINYFLGFQEAIGVYLKEAGVISNARAARGVVYVYLIAGLSASLLVIPEYFVAKSYSWSPTNVSNSFPKWFFVFLGYVCAAIALCLLYMFE